VNRQLFLDRLMKEPMFKFPDREKLAEAVDEAEFRYDGAQSWGSLREYDAERSGDTIPALAKPIGKVIRLLEEPVNLGRITDALVAEGAGDVGDVAYKLQEVVERLAFIQRVLAKATRKGRPGPPPTHPDLMVLVESLANFWKASVGDGKFKYDHDDDAWAAGDDGIDEPTSPAGLFVFRVIKHLAPDRVKDADTVLRAYKDKE